MTLYSALFFCLKQVVSDVDVFVKLEVEKKNICFVNRFLASVTDVLHL